MRVLSTKKLTLAQKELLLNSGLSFVEYDALSVQFLPFMIPENASNAIFTSGHAVDAVFSEKTSPRPSFDLVFCVGPKTKQKLEDFGQKVTKMAKNSEELGNFLAKNYKNESFSYFCGQERREELPNVLKSSKNSIFEVKTYKTIPNLVKFDQKWDGILFFSPRGIQSYLAKNSLEDSMAVVIGETTVSEIKKHTENYVMANSTTVESVIAKAAKTLLHVSN